MKQQLILFLSRFSYPQKDFAKSIIHAIKNNKNNVQLLIDAPCGNGETTNLFAKKLNCTIIGADISETSIQYAKKNYANSIQFKTQTIHGLLNEINNVDAFCLINSLFLLPQPQQILLDIKNILSTTGKLYVIIPNINSDNYNNFIKKNPSVNNLELNFNEFNLFAQNCGYTLINTKKLCYTNVYGRKELKLFSVFSPFYLRFLSFLFKKFTKREPSYFLFIFSKN